MKGGRKVSEMADATETPVPGAAGLEAEKVSPTWLVLQRLGDFQESIRDIRVDMSQIKSDLNTLRTDVHKEFGDVRKEIGDVRSTVIWWALGTGIGVIVTVVLTGVAIVITLKG